MAQLPDYAALGERPSPVLPRRTPLVAEYRPTSGFEEVPAQTLSRAANEMEGAARLALHAQEQQDTLRAEEAVTLLRQKQIDMTFGKDGFANLKGGDAVNRPLLKQYGAQFDQAAAEIGAGLGNDFQKQLFTRRAQIAGLQLREDIVRHVAQQSNVYAENVFKSKIDTEIQAAALRWNTPDAAAVPLLNINNAITDYASRNGMPQEWIDDTRMKAQAKVYDGIVRQALASDPQQARQLFNLYSDKLLANDRAALDHQIDIRIVMAENAKRIEADRIEKAQAKAEKEAIQATQEDMVQKLGKGQLRASDILNSNLPAVGLGSKEHFLNVLHTRANEAAERPIRTVPSVMLDLFERIHLPYNDPRKIVDENDINKAYLNKQVSFADLVRLREEVKQDGRGLSVDTQRVRQTAFGMLSRSLLGSAQPELASEAAYRFSNDLDQKIDDYRKAGKDPRSLFTPGTSDYVLDPKRVMSYLPSARAAVADEAKRVSGQTRVSGKIGEPAATATPKRLPGESPAAYLQRIGQ